MGTTELTRQEVYSAKWEEAGKLFHHWFCYMRVTCPEPGFEFVWKQALSMLFQVNAKFVLDHAKWWGLLFLADFLEEAQARWAQAGVTEPEGSISAQGGCRDVHTHTPKPEQALQAQHMQVPGAVHIS